MTDIENKLRLAIAAGDAKTVGEISDHLRFTRKMNYSAQIELVSRIGCNPDDYEDLLYEADRLSSEQ